MHDGSCIKMEHFSWISLEIHAALPEGKVKMCMHNIHVHVQSYMIFYMYSLYYDREIKVLNGKSYIYTYMYIVHVHY